MTDTTSFPTTTLERTTQYFFLLALFSVSFATALTNLFAVLTCAGFVLSLSGSPALRRVLRSPPALLALALLALFIVGASWSIAPRADIVQALKKYAKLLILPIGIALSWRDPTLPARALRWFLAGAGVLAASCYLVWVGHMPTSSLGWWRVGDAKDSFAFKNHITIGILLGFAALDCFLKATYSAGARKRMLAIAAGIFFSIPIVFLNQGRTGYVALFVGLSTLFLLRARLTPLRTLFGLGAIVLLFVGFYATSPNFKSRTDDLIREVQTQDGRTPNGLRMSFFQVGFQVIADNPVLGLGTGSFAEAYAPTAKKVWPEGSELAVARHQPHSEFVLVAVQLGLLGALVYFAMLGTLGAAALAGRSYETDSLALLWTIYVVTSSFNSLLWDPTEAYWFLMLAGCLYVAGTRMKVRQAPTISVIVTTYNRPDALETVLEACFDQDDKDFDIVIADDGSTAATRECIERLKARSPVPLQHVWQPDQGFRAAMARNRGTLAARGEYIVFLDGDCIAQRDFIARHRKLARRGYLVSGSRVLLGAQLTRRILADRIDLHRMGLGDKLRFRLAGDINKVLQLLVRWPDAGRARRRFSWRRIKSCNLGVWRADLDKVNGFDESFEGWGHEDSDLVVRLFNAGVMRKDGAFATEVFHLWHREAQRDQESSNKRLVLERAQNGTVRATKGLR